MTPQILKSTAAIRIVQRRELAEFFGFETRNKYEIRTPEQEVLGFAAEQQKGLLGFLARQFLGHWRRFDIQIFNHLRQPVLLARHPFRFFFQRLEIFALPENRMIGALQQRFSILYKRFDVQTATGQVTMEVRSPLWRIWTFEFQSQGRTLALLRKKWSGFLKEALLDADNFELTFADQSLSGELRQLLIAAALFVDLQYFEKKAE